MKYFANFLFLFVVIHATTYARYLLVELNNEEGDPNSAFLAEGTTVLKLYYLLYMLAIFNSTVIDYQIF